MDDTYAIFCDYCVEHQLATPRSDSLEEVLQKTNDARVQTRLTSPRMRRLLTTKQVITAARNLSPNKPTVLHGGHIRSNKTFRFSTGAIIYTIGQFVLVLIRPVSATHGSSDWFKDFAPDGQLDPDKLSELVGESIVLPMKLVAQEKT